MKIERFDGKSIIADLSRQVRHDISVHGRGRVHRRDEERLMMAAVVTMGRNIVIR